jgi:hypothetical protein
VSKTNYPTDEELATAVEKIMTVVREVIADFKAAAPTLVKTLSDDEWANSRPTRIVAVGLRRNSKADLVADQASQRYRPYSPPLVHLGPQLAEGF